MLILNKDCKITDYYLAHSRRNSQLYLRVEMESKILISDQPMRVSEQVLDINSERFQNRTLSFADYHIKYNMFEPSKPPFNSYHTLSLYIVPDIFALQCFFIWTSEAAYWHFMCNVLTRHIVGRKQ